jgi:hypothetical protein
MREAGVTVFDGTFVDRVNAEAKDVHFWRTVLTVVAAALYGIGWTIGWVFKGIWLVLTWCFAAAKVGFGDALGRDEKRKGSG